MLSIQAATRYAVGHLLMGGLLVGCSATEADSFAPDLSIAQAEKSVVVLYRREAQDLGSTYFKCSAAVVAPNLVLTARHCVRPEADLWEGCQNAASPSVAAAQVEIRTEECGRDEEGECIEPALAKGLEIVPIRSSKVCGDMAFIVLDTNVDLEPLAIRTHRPPRIGEEVAFVGFRRDDPTGVDTHLTRTTRETVILDVSDEAEPSDVAPYTVAVRGDMCAGDSGGPLLSAASGAIIGVFSRRLEESDTCNPERRRYMERLDLWPEFIEEGFESAGARPLAGR